MLLRFSFFSTARFHSIINILIVFLQIFFCFYSENSHFISHQTTCYIYPAIRPSELKCRGSFGTKPFREKKSYNYRHSEPSSSSFNLCARALAKFTVSAEQISLRKRWNFPDKDKMRSLITFHIYREVLLRRFEHLFYREISTTTSYSAKRSENMKRFQIIVSRIFPCVLLPGFRRWSIKNERHKTTFRHKVSEELQKAISCFFDFISSFSLFFLWMARLENFNHHCADSISLSLTHSLCQSDFLLM